MSYLILKHLHVGSVILSLSLFSLRGIWMLCDSQMLQRRWARVLPHMIDTVLLTSALLLAWQVQQLPFRDHWLTAKVCGLLLYIVLGSIALKRGRSKGIRVAALLAAWASAGYIVSVALTRQPLPWQFF
ncbi:SirB2 family protein [Marinobacterium arenosum]|uniref:SirB2 family protein n=1 Tax=Marinobacterium arenosum TaxID=2862496 RepID=UPI001C94AD67|nr:SirB2 family protein [Marinobacterium arenosum]MBY4676838.1 SirB2 family protein [Marinobacterium arenosum]